ncbi:hypothetical protein KO498_02400 [Lentibacter algarum]|uniref:hypothetical protein n=1 Tax=Lentibacter algarum TaxID=576131 RepID=UPI001C07D1AF|nr:hypothetical protein [Lentibacter algarum]MBU2980655.1 hypothetical protein [Lentibacter algarum]
MNASESLQPKIRFIIFSMARSGTSWLTTALRSHPDILCHGEALLPRHFDRHIFGSAKAVLSAEMCERDPVAFLQALYSHNDGHAAVGCKVFPGHSKTAQAALLADQSIAKIVLKRENALAAWSSLLTARKTGRWNANVKEKGADISSPVMFEPAKFEAYLKRRARFFRKIDRRLQGPRLNLTYATDIMQQRARPVLEFLGVPAEVTLSSDKRKMLGRSITERFENTEELAAYLKETGRAGWAYE